MVGASKGPRLWLDCATLNLINSFPLLSVPITVSPTANVPVVIVISKSLGIIYLFISWPSKKA